MAEHKLVKLYNGEVEIDFTPGNHAYKLVGTKERIISVTAATGTLDKSRQLINWAIGLMRDDLLAKADTEGHVINPNDIIAASMLHSERKTDAGNTGKLVHEWAEAYIKGLNPPMPTDPRVQYGVIAFLKLVKERDVRFVASEKIVYSRKYNYVGQMDNAFTLGAEDHKIMHPGDFKTGGGIYTDHFYQVAAYQEADTEESGQEYGSKWIFRFAKEDKYNKKTGELIEKAGTFEAREIPRTEHEADLAAFLGLLAVKRREKQLSTWAKDNDDV